MNQVKGTMHSRQTKENQYILTGRDSSIVAKAGMWYTVCNFLIRGMAFLSTPIFTRIMSKPELGDFTNFSSWASILLVICSFDLSQSIIRSRLEHGDDMDSYIWSILSFSTIWTLILYAAAILFLPFFSGLFQIDERYIHILFLYLLTAPAYNMLITKHRAKYKYKTFVALTGVMTVSGLALSIVLVLLLDDKLYGRIWGYYIPYIFIGGAIFIYLAVKGRKIKVQYWKYACVICLPLVPHVLSLYMLSSSDKIIITRLCGSEYTAMYGVAYNAYHIVTILFHSMNQAWAPWLLESLHKKNYQAIMNTSKKYIGVFLVFIIGVIMIVPEIILILGGNSYLGAVYCLPPLIASCVFQFIYTMYVNIEFYEKKTVGVSIATIIATVLNILLNLIFIPMSPENSYVIAAYTTLAGYIVLFILHYYLVKRMKMDFVYDIKFITCVLVVTLAVTGIMNLLYKTTIIRYCIVAVYSGVVLFFGYKHRNELLHILKGRHKTKRRECT